MNPQEPYNTEARRKGIIFAVISTIVLIIGFVVFSWISSHGYIAVTATSAQGDTSFTFINQANQATTTARKSSISYKKLVSKGQYQVLVRQDNRTYTAYVSAGGFLKKQIVTATLENERSRTYVGENPLSCTYINDLVLASFECGGKLNTAKLHVPATPQQPSYIQTNPAKIFDISEGIAATASGDILLTRPSDADTGEGASHSAYNIQKGFSLTSRTKLLDLRSERNYAIKPLSKGFIAYDTLFKEVFYYESLNAKPKKIPLAKPSQDYKPYAISTHNDVLAVAYSDGRSAGEIVTQDMGGTTMDRVNVSKIYGTVVFCANERLCLLDNKKQLDIFDISGNTSKLNTSISGVSAIVQTPGGLAIVNTTGVIRLNVDTLEGYIDYSFNDYKYCGISPSAVGFVLCVQNKFGSYALSIDQKQESDEIDKKVTALLKVPEIKGVSVSNHIIFISPNAGEPTFQASLSGYGYNPATVEKVSARIDQALIDIGIDLTSYKVINTLRAR